MWTGRPFTAPVQRLIHSLRPLHPAIVQPVPGEADKVFDGDCFRTIRDRKTLYIRLWGADAPECPQPYGLDAKRALIALIAHQPLDLLLVSTDQYHRKICRVAVPGCPDVGLELIRRGLAWHDPRFAPHAIAYAAAQAAARNDRRGLWADPHPTAPWDWRKSHHVANPDATAPATIAPNLPH